MWPVQNHMGTFQCDQASVDHPLHLRKDSLDHLVGGDDLDNDGEIQRKPQYALGMDSRVRAETGNSTKHGRPGKIPFPESFKQNFIERSSFEFVALADEYSHQRLLALKGVRHRYPRTPRSIVASRKPQKTPTRLNSTLPPM